MKTTGLFFVMMFLLSLSFAKNTTAQAIVDNDFYLVFYDNDEVAHEAIRAKKTISASGMITITGTFQLDKDHPLVPPKGWWPTLIEVHLVTDGKNGEQEFVSDEKVDIPQNGKFNVSLHVNGSGNSLPWGWYTPEIE